MNLEKLTDEQKMMVEGTTHYADILEKTNIPKGSVPMFILKSKIAPVLVLGRRKNFYPKELLDKIIERYGKKENK